MTDDLIARLRAMYSHRGDGIPTQYVNPNGPEAADEIERLREALEPFAEAADQAERLVGHDGPLDPVVPLSACIQARRAIAEEKSS